MNIDAKSHIPIYLQIAEQIRASVAAGVYRTGEALPSLRALAVEVQVNPNTVQRAYDELERQGLVYSRRGVGLFVAKRGVRSAQARAEYAVREAFRQGIQAAEAASMSAKRIRIVFDELMEQYPKEVMPR